MFLRNTAMKTSELRQNTRQHKDKKRLTSSFFLTCFIYLPAFVFAWNSVPETTFKAAGQEQTVALSFAQMSGGGVSTPEIVATEPLPESEPELQKEPEPEPEEIVTPLPKPEPAVKKAQQNRVQKKLNAPKKTQRNQEVKQTAPKTTELAEPTNVSQSSKALAPAPIQADQGAATASAQGGIATLVFGEKDDPFLAKVKRCIESELRYTRRARQLRLEGTVTVQFVVRKDGSMDAFEIHTSSGQVMLDNMAKRAVEPAQAHWGQPQNAVRLRIPLRYELK